MNSLLNALWTPIKQTIQFFKQEGYYAQAPKLSSSEKHEKANSAINKIITVVGITPLNVYAGFEGTPFKVDVEFPENLKLGDKLYVYGVESHDTLLCIPSDEIHLPD